MLQLPVPFAGLGQSDWRYGGEMHDKVVDAMLNRAFCRLNEDEIRRRAYLLWEKDGCLDGEELVDTEDGPKPLREVYWHSAALMLELQALAAASLLMQATGIRDVYLNPLSQFQEDLAEDTAVEEEEEEELELVEIE